MRHHPCPTAEGRVVILILIALSVAIQTSQAEDAPATPRQEHFSHLVFTPPQGWTRVENGGWVVFTPPDVPAGQTVWLGISPGGPSNRDLGEEFVALMAASLHGMSTVDPGTPVPFTDAQGLKAISQGVTLQDATGHQHARLYIARRNGGRFESLAFSSSDPALTQKYSLALKAFFSSIAYDGAPPVAVAPPTPPAPTNVPAQPDQPATITPPTVSSTSGASTSGDPAMANAVAPVAPAAPAKLELAPPQEGKHVQGWIAVTTIGYGGGLICDYYWFRPDGGVYFGVPNGASTDADYAALQKSEPANCGTHGIVGGDMTLQRNGQKPVKTNFGGGVLGGGVVRGVWYFTKGQRLEGMWENGNSIHGRLNIAASADWTFHADGTFDNGSVAIIGNRNGDTGKAVSNKGTYELDGHVLTLKYDDGTTKTAETFGTDDKAKPYILGIDGVGYHNVK
jgi:hypothetical protein